jgi:ActR/RegA family two-component response regulator
MARPEFVVAWSAEDDEACLKARYRAEADGTRRLRLQGLWLLRQGRAVSEVAAAMGVHRRTVDRWVAWYRAVNRPGFGRGSDYWEAAGSGAAARS